MRLSACLVLCALLLLPLRGDAEAAGESADHDALRKLKADALAAVNSRNMKVLAPALHEPFVATLLTQDKFESAAAMQTWFDGLFNRPVARIAKLTMKAEADDLSKIYTGTFSVTTGSTSELYEMADGRSFDMRGRWTAVCLKEGGQWRLVALHTGTNFLDNPLINAVAGKVVSTGMLGAAGGAIVGVALGLLLGSSLWRKKSSTPERAAA